MIRLGSFRTFLPLGCAALLCSATLASEGPPNKRPASDFAGTKAGQVRDDNGLKLKLVWCPPGKFQMGSS